jgi:hypothetical protein
MDRGCHFICLLATEYAMVDEVNIGVRDRLGFVIRCSMLVTTMSIRGMQPVEIRMMFWATRIS